MIFIFIVNEMASKSAMAEFYHRLLKKHPAEEGGSNNLGSVDSEDPKFTFTPGSFDLEF